MPETIAEVTPLTTAQSETAPVVTPQAVPKVAKKGGDEEPVPDTRQTPAAQRQPGDSGATTESLVSFEAGPPSVVDMELDLFAGADARFLGRARGVYTASAGRYAVVVEGGAPQGDIETGGEKWRLQVFGSIRHAGLYPEGYSGEGEVARQLVSEGQGAEKTLFRRRMQDGLFDSQSLFFQFMHLPIERMKTISVASPDGSFRIFEANRQDEEVIEVENLGALKTNKYLFSTQGSSETYEVWLLLQPRAVPLRVRHTSPDGSIIDQRVRTLRATR